MKKSRVENLKKHFERTSCIELTLIFLAGAFFGISITTLIFRAYLVGELRIDYSDPDYGPYMFLEITKGVGDISSKKYVILKVDLKNLVPRK